jgi:hypothetical protein
MPEQNQTMTDVLSRYDVSIDHERRRTVRIKRSGIKANQLEDMDRPAVKFAEEYEEYRQAFSLVYSVYEKKKFIHQSKSHGMLYSIYSLLPQTTHIIAKSYETVISNLTQIFDDPVFGLPMDSIYKRELDEIRDQDRKVVELSALATPREHRWKNIFHYLVQVMYWFSVFTEVDDVCIAINPRHVRYYNNMFPFENFGPERNYSRVGAPAIGLRGRVKESMDHMMEICQSLGFDTPLYAYFYRMTGWMPRGEIPFLDQKVFQQVNVKRARIDSDLVQDFLDKDEMILDELDERQKEYLLQIYPQLKLGK